MHFSVCLKELDEVQLGQPSQVQNEEAGQLYAYRVSEYEVYLGTRDNATLGAAVGIEMEAAGVYVCVAINTNESEAVNLTVNVISKSFVFFLLI